MRSKELTEMLQQSVSHQLLPKDEWTKPEEDVPYLTPLIKEIEAELNERENMDAMVLAKKK
jgi:ubiquinol-cytochrome c reductase subunit 7